MFQRATKKKVKLKMALVGVENSGKTRGALEIATGLIEGDPTGKIAVLDSENARADMYSNMFVFDSDQIEEFSPMSYIKKIKEAEAAGYEVLIIDSISHEWIGKGGILEMVEKSTRMSPNQNPYAAWKEPTAAHLAFYDAIIRSKLHIICTMRAKEKVILTRNDKGKMEPKKMGLAAIQRDGINHEFSIVLNMAYKIATVAKDGPGLFTEQNFQITRETGKILLDWLNDGDEIIEVVSEETPLKYMTHSEMEAAEKDKFEEYKVKLNDCKTIDELQELFKEVWRTIKLDKHKSILTDIKDDMKSKLQDEDFKLQGAA